MQGMAMLMSMFSGLQATSAKRPQNSPAGTLPKFTGPQASPRATSQGKALLEPSKNYQTASGDSTSESSENSHRKTPESRTSSERPDAIADLKMHFDEKFRQLEAKIDRRFDMLLSALQEQQLRPSTTSDSDVLPLD